MPGRVLDSKEVNMDTGWIKIYRSMANWGWYTDSPVKDLFLHLLLTANWVPGVFRGRDISPGQKVTSVANLAAETGLSVKQVRTALEKLKSTGEITVEATNKFTVITVVNYCKYQCLDLPEGQTKDNQMANKGQTDGNQTANEGQTKGNNIRNIRRKEEKEGKKERNIFIKPTLEEVTTYINENMFCVDPDAFYDYYEANGWMVGNRKMKDWKATVRNWERREQKNKRPTHKERAF